MNTQELALVTELKALAIRRHKVCPDEWYSCPMSPDGCADPEQSGCTCGASEHNQKVATVFAQLLAYKEGNNDCTE